MTCNILLTIAPILDLSRGLTKFTELEPEREGNIVPQLSWIAVEPFWKFWVKVPQCYNGVS